MKRASVTIIIVAVIALACFIALGAISKEQPHDLLPTDGFLRERFTWLEHEEGTFNNGTIAGDANAQRAPCEIFDKHGKIITPSPHTVGGVQYKTFVHLAPLLGYSATCKNFEGLALRTKSPIWMSIAKHFFDIGLGYTSNPVLATYIGLYVWGSGYVTREADVKKILAKESSVRLKLLALVELRKAWFESAGFSDSYTKSVKERADRFKTMALKYV